MLNFLPQIYKEELLYSVISRYKQMCGMISKAALSKDLFNGKTLFKSILFPQYLKFFMSNLPYNSKLSMEELILKHTLFPFYTAFLAEDNAENIYNGMVEGIGTSFENQIGLAGSKVNLNNYLKFCPLCYRDDIEMLGESYWRRSHQIVGALYCLQHEVTLANSNVASSHNLINYSCADVDVCNQKVLNDPHSIKIKRLNLKYLQNASYLLDENQKRKKPTFIIDYYIDRLREKGFATKSGQVCIKELLKAFMDFYPRDYLELMQSNFEIENGTNWLRLFVRKDARGSNRNVLRHLLLIQFLEINLDDMFNCNKVIGKIEVVRKINPTLDFNKKRADWLNVIKNNPNANRLELKNIGKGAHQWVYLNDREWYDQVTPRVKERKKRRETIDWNQKDEEFLLQVKHAVENLMIVEGKPIRITPANIRRFLGQKRKIFHEKLLKTGQYLTEITEDIGDYRIRKIKWAKNDLEKQGMKITPYKIQLHAGFGGAGGRMGIIKIIKDILLTD